MNVGRTDGAEKWREYHQQRAEEQKKERRERADNIAYRTFLVASAIYYVGVAGGIWNQDIPVDDRLAQEVFWGLAGIPMSGMAGAMIGVLTYLFTVPSGKRKKGRASSGRNEESGLGRQVDEIS